LLRGLGQIRGCLFDAKKVSGDGSGGVLKVLENAQAGAAAAQEEALNRVRVARHSERPYALDYIELLFTDFVELHGDRRFADDQALICGFADFRDLPVAVVAHQKGRDTKQRRLRNFGMPKPEGYRKALRVMKLAEKFGRPIITLVDTPGAYPGIDAEERGQAEAIATNLLVMARLEVPIIVSIIGEGGSGGALAIGVGDVVQMLENAIYSVISPEGCAAILWKDSAEAGKAAQALKLTATDLRALGIVDRVVPEPGEGAHTSLEEAARFLGEALHEDLQQTLKLPAAERLARRYAKIRALGS
jgi:acetyl-CoA carboxylase carboxyl transferase subunit alpha